MSPSGSGSANESGGYNNYYKAQRDASANPAAYNTASSAIAQGLNQAGAPASWQKGMEELAARESSFNPNAANSKSTAKGLFQFLDSTRSNYGGKSVNWSDPIAQSAAAAKYVKDRYGTPEDALRFWDKNGWY
jgi:hypothetical protein